MLPARLVCALAAFVLLLPSATATPECDAPGSFCVGGNQAMEGEGTCPGGSERYHFILGYEGTQTGSYTLAGAGTMCEGDETRQGVFLVGAPVPAFVGAYESDTRCGIEAGTFVFVSYEQEQRYDALTCRLM